MRRNRKLFQFQYWCQWCLSIWTLGWCHSWWRVDAHGWCTEGEWARYEVRMQKEGCVGKISRRTGIFSVKYRAIFGTDFNQYSAHILATKCKRDMKRHCMEKIKKYFFSSAVLTIIIIITTWPACGAKIRKIWHILPISRLYRLLPLLASTSQLDGDDDIDAADAIYMYNDRSQGASTKSSS